MTEKEEQKIELKEAVSAELRPVLGSAIQSKGVGQALNRQSPTNLESAVPLETSAGRQPDPLPFGKMRFLVTLLFLSILLGPWVQILRMGMLAKISDLTNANNLFEARIAYAAAWEPLQPSLSLAIETELKAFCISKYGLNDPRTAYMQVLQAQQLLNTGAEKEAMSAWQDALKQLKSPTESTPSGTTAALRKLGDAYYQREDYQSAIQLYRVALGFWDKIPGAGTKTNVEADLAQAHEAIGDYSNAAKYMQMALDGSRSMGDHGFNVFRATKISKYYAQLKQYAESLKFATEAVTILKRSSDTHPFFAAEATKQYEWAKFAASHYREGE